MVTWVYHQIDLWTLPMSGPIHPASQGILCRGTTVTVKFTHQYTVQGSFCHGTAVTVKNDLVRKLPLSVMWLSFLTLLQVKQHRVLRWLNFKQHAWHIFPMSIWDFNHWLSGTIFHITYMSSLAMTVGKGAWYLKICRSYQMYGPTDSYVLSVQMKIHQTRLHEKLSLLLLQHSN